MLYDLNEGQFWKLVKKLQNWLLAASSWAEADGLYLEDALVNILQIAHETIFPTSLASPEWRSIFQNFPLFSKIQSGLQAIAMNYLAILLQNMIF